MALGAIPEINISFRYGRKGLFCGVFLRLWALVPLGPPTMLDRTGVRSYSVVVRTHPLHTVTHSTAHTADHHKGKQP